MSDRILAKFKSSPSFSFRSKLTKLRSSKNPQMLPSPNSYSPLRPLKNQVHVKFSKSMRKTFFDSNIHQSPGPGQYETLNSTIRSFSSVKSEGKIKTFTSRFYQKSQQKPGPGAYDVKNDFKKTLPSFSISKKNKTFQDIQIQKNEFKPSPAQYDLSPNRLKSSSVISIPKSPRMKQKIQISPGPGKYETNEELYFSQKSFGKRTFSKSLRKIAFEINQQSPGPSKYAFESSFEINKRKQKGFSCRKKFSNLTQNQQLPGPGQYESNPNINYRSTESCKIPQAQRNTFEGVLIKQKSPGPGKYQNLLKTYEKFNFHSRSAPKFSKAKLQVLSANKTQKVDKFYDTKINVVKKSSSSFSIGGAKRKIVFQKIAKVPGPGDYNPNDSYQTQKVNAPKFGASQRTDPLLNKLKVGPGQYFNEQTSSSIQKKGTKFSKQKRDMNFVLLQNTNKAALKLASLTGPHKNMFTSR